MSNSNPLIIYNPRLQKSCVANSYKEAQEIICCSSSLLSCLINNPLKETSSGWCVIDRIRSRLQRNKKRWHHAEVIILLQSKAEEIEISRWLGRSPMSIQRKKEALV